MPLCVKSFLLPLLLTKSKNGQVAFCVMFNRTIGIVLGNYKTNVVLPMYSAASKALICVATLVVFE